MVRYEVKITANAQLGLSKIVENHDNYTLDSSLRYINAIRQLCSGLKTMPFRYEKRMINGTQYRSFTYKAHQIFYRVEEAENLVLIIAVLNGAQDWTQNLV